MPLCGLRESEAFAGGIFQDKGCGSRYRAVSVGAQIKDVRGEDVEKSLMMQDLGNNIGDGQEDGMNFLSAVFQEGSMRRTQSGFNDQEEEGKVDGRSREWYP
ncbi:hypothetical protein MLD38_034734 [Melastoma candidum]|uniref:Uncharacterized protein n=1 Tax=Melastoma candidum TaxID=119954 RepID=A0ACB9MBE3_9MYRT|nr:hypothetical protein MLD38_034734 [Melastoma candidum]